MQGPLSTEDEERRSLRVDTDEILSARFANGNRSDLFFYSNCVAEILVKPQLFKVVKKVSGQFLVNFFNFFFLHFRSFRGAYSPHLL